MQAIRTRVAGVDVHKQILAITILIGEADKEPTFEQFECNTFTEDLMAMAIVLKERGVTEVAMESTGVFWKPVYNVWSKMGIRCTVGNARTMRNVPGRKTDMNDSHWIAQLHRFGLIRASFIPEDKFQQLRLLSRHRTNLTDDIARVKNRVQRILEDGNIKLGSVVSDVFGVAGLNVLRLLADGTTRADVLANAVTTNIKRKGEIKKSLTNCFTSHHIFLIKELMQQYDDLKARVIEVDRQLAVDVTPYAHLIEELRKIPGIDMTLAVGIIAEATNDVSNFADERKFAAWAGVASGNNESAGKKKDQDVVTARRILENSLSRLLTEPNSSAARFIALNTTNGSFH
jgi:transposase